jgi:hypothetical protein
LSFDYYQMLEDELTIVITTDKQFIMWKTNMHNPPTTTYEREKSQQATKFWQVASAKTLWQPFTYEHKNN